MDSWESTLKDIREVLARRADIMRRMRAFFDSRGFLEVETPVRISAPAPEEHIDCPPVVGGGYLRASPELQMKKLLAMGMDRIYQIGPCFRDGEKGRRHNSEFTMIEWYRGNASYLDIADDLESLLSELGLVSCENKPKRLLVREAYREFAQWDPWSDFDQDRFDFDMATKIEPAIAEIGGGVFLVDYPKEAASLAKVRDGVAERWEFYYDGIELANCFTELCDRDEQLRRFRLAKSARVQLGESDYPIDDEFIECLANISSAAGVALGVDRLVMAIVGVPEISSVRMIE